MAHKNLMLSGVALAVVLAFAPAAQAAATQQDSCTKNFTQASAAGEDLKTASILLEKAGNCCSTDMGATQVQGLIADIKAIVANTNKVVSKGGDKNDAGKILSIALDCAGQPNLVTTDPTLYSEVLADSAQVVELAQDGDIVDDKWKIPLNPARNPPAFRPSNNQQPTVSVEQK